MLKKIFKDMYTSDFKKENYKVIWKFITGVYIFINIHLKYVSLWTLEVNWGSSKQVKRRKVLSEDDGDDHITQNQESIRKIEVRICIFPKCKEINLFWIWIYNLKYSFISGIPIFTKLKICAPWNLA